VSDFDLAIVGSGFGGSLMAMIARRLGLRVVLIERGRHPRFAIGESASPLAGILIEQLADRYDLPRLQPLSAYGPWQRSYPHVVCGLKRGFTYLHHEHGGPYLARRDRSNQLLVEASPSDELSDTHWLRSDVDAFLVEEAVALGVEYLDDTAVGGVEWRPDRTASLTGARHGRAVNVRAAFVIDASGPRGFLSRALGIGDVGFRDYPATQALFSHFTGVARCDEMSDFGMAPREPSTDSGSPRAVSRGEGMRGAPVYGAPPYPADDAALHHVFDGGWMWVLRFGNGVTSAGIAVTDALAGDLRLSDGAPAWSRFLARFPSVAAQFAEATPIREFTWMPRLAWRAESAAGSGWAMLPSAAAFIDPLFSTGIPLTLLGIERVARILERRATTPNVQLPAPQCPELPGVGDWGSGVSASWDEYSRVTLEEADHVADFIAGCYAAFPRFEEFTAYSMFYFAAASFGEMARRHGVSPEEARFLASHDPAFAAATRQLSPARTTCTLRSVADAIEPLNIAGLCDPSRRNWYPFVESMPVPQGTGRLAVKEP
jgi:FADH2 O2-dependent halogenase